MRLLIYILALFFTADAVAQSGRKYVREGNKLYNEKRYRDADSLYREGLKDTASYKSVFNLGDALYKQGKYKEAADYFNSVVQKHQDKNIKQQAWHNIGNCYLESKNYKESVEAYKNALRLNPTDEDTRYNLAYAQQKLKKEEEQKKKDKENKNEKDKDKNKDKDEKKDEKKEDPNKDKDKKEDQKEKDRDKDKQQDQQEQQRQMSKEDAQRMLDALNNDEKKVQEKLKKKGSKGQKVKVQKDW
jgi:Ca-activated chloride channel homolog